MGMETELSIETGKRIAKLILNTQMHEQRSEKRTYQVLNSRYLFVFYQLLKFRVSQSRQRHVGGGLS